MESSLKRFALAIGIFALTLSTASKKIEASRTCRSPKLDPTSPAILGLDENKGLSGVDETITSSDSFKPRIAVFMRFSYAIVDYSDSLLYFVGDDNSCKGTTAFAL
jgi:hypothetical protein